MFEQHFLSPDTADPAVFGPLQGGERVMWRGRCGVAEYAFDQAASMPRWTLPESTDVLVTDRRVIYAHTPKDGERVRSGELQWLWPQHIRVQPGARSDNRGAAATQIQLVCGGADGTFPALVFAGGDLATAGDADRVANTIRQAIARFRIDNAARLDLDPHQTRMLSRALIGPEFRNHQGGAGQTVSVIGALLVNRPSAAAAPAPGFAPVSDSAPAPESSPTNDDHASFLDRAEGTRPISYRPGRAADAARAIMAARAEQETQQSEPAVASRAADLAARVADLVNASVPEEKPEVRLEEKPEPSGESAVIIEFPLRMSKRPAEPRIPEPRHSEPRYTDPRRADDVPTANLAARAESLRKTAARMAANSGRGRLGARRPSDREPGITSRGNRDR
ncbi:translation initiation factor 2 [Actinoplanes sp. NPDC049265]|uniref:translation initiation factor 2 n=1 Tax=Actinoplanes sp. NPDC049265 TaxID=3363902 RepID=UPI00371C452E